jgi:hypothetical protein
MVTGLAMADILMWLVVGVFVEWVGGGCVCGRDEIRGWMLWYVCRGREQERRSQKTERYDLREGTW